MPWEVELTDPQRDLLYIVKTDKKRKLLSQSLVSQSMSCAYDQAHC